MISLERLRMHRASGNNEREDENQRRSFVKGLSLYGSSRAWVWEHWGGQDRAVCDMPIKPSRIWPLCSSGYIYHVLCSCAYLYM
jgi:hypothetical protein